LILINRPSDRNFWNRGGSVPKADVGPYVRLTPALCLDICFGAPGRSGL